MAIAGHRTLSQKILGRGIVRSVLVMILVGFVSAFPEIPQNARYMPGQALVVFEDDLKKTDAEHLGEKYECRIVYRGRYRNFAVLQGEPERDVGSLASDLSGEPGVLVAEPNYVRRALWEPDDPYFADGSQWSFDSTHIDMPRAWEMERGGDEMVRIGILDTGVAYEDHAIPSHEVNEVTSADGFYHVAPDLTGTTFASGYDFIHGDEHPNDQNGHGTHVCGTVAQTTGNGYGCAGIAFRATIVPVQVLSYYGYGTSAHMIDGLDHASQVGCHIVNMSFGSPDSSGAEHLAVQGAYEAGVTLVASAGNAGMPGLWYPAGYPEVISVGATTTSNTRWSGSNFGEDLDLVAPGGSPGGGIVQETFKDPNVSQDPGYHTVVDTFDFLWSYGTSMAAPHVSGVAGLIVSAGYEAPDLVRWILTSTASDLDTVGYDVYTGYGLLDAGEAIASVHSDSAPDESYIDILPTVFSGTSLIEYGVHAPSEIELSVHDAAGRLIEILFEGSRDFGVYFTTWNPEDIPSGVYFLRLKGAGDMRASRKFLYFR
jgi:serine protease